MSHRVRDMKDMQAFQLSKLQYQPLPNDVPLNTTADRRPDPYEWSLPPDLDVFFRRLYKFWHRKGFLANLLHELFNLIGLLFVLVFSSILLFCIDWSTLRSECNEWEEDCDIAQRLIQSPIAAFRWSYWSALKLTYVCLFLLYWLGTVGVAISELKNAWEIHRFCRLKLGISEEQMPWISWSELVHRLVLIQRTTRLCLHRDLNACDIVNRILRKENYLIGMIDKGILQLAVPLPGFKKRPIMTKMMEWSLRWGLLTPMFNHDFEIRELYRTNPEFVSERFRTLAILHLILAPFLLVFVGMYLLMMYVERFYHTPSTMIERSWSPYARWRLREFNEMDHQLETRLDRSHKAAQDYVDQFPNYALIHVGKLMSFVLGSFMALLLFAALLQDGLLEADLMKRNLVWWAAVLMIGLKLARGLVAERPVLDPEMCLQRVVHHTHFCPRLWRGHARSREVQGSFNNMFRYRPLNIVDEVLSIFLTPYLLYFCLPNCSGDKTSLDGMSNPSLGRIVQFLQNYTVRVPGVGDVCSLATFDFEKHGNRKYGSSEEGTKLNRSKQGKMEKSFLSFVDFYPTWRPLESGWQMLQNLEPFVLSSFQSASSIPGPLRTSIRDPREAHRPISVNCPTSVETLNQPSCSQSQSSRSVWNRDPDSRVQNDHQEQWYRRSDLHQALESFYLSNSQDSDEHRIRCLQ